MRFSCIGQLADTQSMPSSTYDCFELSFSYLFGFFMSFFGDGEWDDACFFGLDSAGMLEFLIFWDGMGWMGMIGWDRGCIGRGRKGMTDIQTDWLILDDIGSSAYS